jgi:hypothetical protein
VLSQPADAKANIMIGLAIGVLLFVRAFAFSRA